MSNSNNDYGHTHGETRCDLHRLERNNYFTGKLLTPRDFITEQAYHAGTQRTTARTVLGTGSVCGLGVDPTLHGAEAGAEPDRLDVTVTSGLVIDGCGRLVVVDEAVTESFDLPVIADGAETNDVSVYVEWRECATESVPRTGMENACETECAPNRLVEYGEVTVVPGPPDAAAGAVGGIDFPDRETVLGIHRAGPDDIGVALDAVPVVLPPMADAVVAGTTTAAAGTTVDVDLAFTAGESVETSTEAAADGTFSAGIDASAYDPGTRVTATVSVDGTVLEVPGVVGDSLDDPFVDDPTVLFDAAQSYYAANRGACSFAEGPVLVGTLHKEAGQSWDLAVFERGPIVYGNELLYAAVASHAADFDNPHQVSLDLDAVEVVDEDGVDGATDTDGGTVLLVSGETYTQGTVLEATVTEFEEEREEDGEGVQGYELRVVTNDRPGERITRLSPEEGVLRIKTAGLDPGPYVVVVLSSTDGLVEFDDGEAAEALEMDETPDALFTVVEGEAPPPEPEPVETSRTRLSVPGFDGPGGDVFLTSTDGSVSITPHLGTRTVDFAASGGAGLTGEQREYVRERSLLNAAESFTFVTLSFLRKTVFPPRPYSDLLGSMTGEFRITLIAFLTRLTDAGREIAGALDADEYVDSGEFLTVFTRNIGTGEQASPLTLVDVEERIGALLRDLIQTAIGSALPIQPLQQYIEATAQLREAVEATGVDEETRAQAVAIAQDRVAETTKNLDLVVEFLLIFASTISRDLAASSTTARHAVASPTYTAFVELLVNPRTMPDLSGMKRHEAEMHVAIRGFDSQVILVDGTTQPGIGINDVESQTPAPGTLIDPGTEITLETVKTPPVDTVKGLGEKSRDALAGKNITTIYDLSTASVDEVVEATSDLESPPSRETIREWQTEAIRLREGYSLTRTEGIDAKLAETLVRGVNVTSEAELAAVSPERLTSALTKAREAGRITAAEATRVEEFDWSTTLGTVRTNVGVTFDPEIDLGLGLGAGSGFTGTGDFRPRF